jgi:hypothetical protein
VVEITWVNRPPVYENVVVFPSASTIEDNCVDEFFTNCTSRDTPAPVLDCVTVSVDPEYENAAVVA